MAKKKKSKKPTGLTLTRDKRKFTAGWKCGTTDYDDGQDAYMYEHYTNGGKDKKRSTNLDPSKSARQKSHSITLSNYYPSTNSKLSKVSFKVRGNRKKNKKGNPTWSNWSSKSFAVDIPYKPVLSEGLDQNEDRTTIFTWTCTQSESNKHMFYDFEWVSVLAKNGANPDWTNPDMRHTANGIDPDTGGSDTGEEQYDDVTYKWSINKDGGSVAISENSGMVYLNTNDTYTRWFKVRSRGPAGHSDWVVEYHIYGTPLIVSEYGDHKPVVKVTSDKRGSSNGSLTIEMAWKAYKRWNAEAKRCNHPIDYMQVQYCIQSPLITTTTKDNKLYSVLDFNPNGASWTDAPGGVIRDSIAFDGYSFSLDAVIPNNQTIFIRTNAIHDRRTTYGAILEAVGGRSYLDPPTGLAIEDVEEITNPDGSKSLSIRITKPKNNCGIVNSFTAIYYRGSESADDEKVIGIVPWGEDSGSMIIQSPKLKKEDELPGLGMKTLIGDYQPVTYSSLPVEYTISNILMESNGIDWVAGTIPRPPALTLDHHSVRPYDTIVASWDWRWSEATSAEISWSNNKNAWQSTSEPTRYVISGVHPSTWNISELEPDTYYVRCRLIREASEATSYGAYSKIESITLSTIPSTPQLGTDTPTISNGSDFTIYWQYFNEDGTYPSKAEIGEATVSNGQITYPRAGFKKVDKTTYDQKETLNAGERKWVVNSTHYLVVRVQSESGQLSNWSQPLAIHIVPPVTASISGTVISTGTLTQLPFTVTVSGVGTDGLASAVITRRDSYSIDRPELRPDEAPDDGFANETIAVASRTGSGELTFDRESLIGRLDDGAYYQIVGTVIDSYGQSDQTKPVDFVVAWEHQALMPSAIVTVDNENLATIIDLQPVQDALAGDSIDIYRLSADRPELIVQGATIGEKYVDPYPTLGEFGGHRIVFVTKDGDYITANNTLAMVNYPDEDEDDENVYRINYFGAVIDFGSEQVRLPYNIELSNKWSKDFTEVKYLGGSVQGYWNKAVSRTGSIKTTVAIEEDQVGPDTIRALRRLAVWPGVCHVRTPDGSSYAANIDVSEDRESQWVRRLATINLEITRVDSQTLDGMTWNEWINNL